MHDLRQRLRPAPVMGRVMGAALALSLLGSCGPQETTDDEDDSGQTGTVRPPRPSASPWTKSVVEGGHVGLHPRLAVSSTGETGVAYFGIDHQVDGVCEEFAVENPPAKMRWTLRYARQSGSSWEVETVATPAFTGPPPGMDLKFSPQGQPVIAAMAGDPQWFELYGYCGANDAALYHREGPESWRVETAVATSNEAATGQPASDFGFVVGYWSTLAFDSQGQPAVAYKDVHAGSIQRDDFARADLEFAHRRGGRWLAEAVDIGSGAGDYNRLIFDEDDVPVIAYYKPTESNIEERIGIWVARQDPQGQGWERVRLFGNGTPEGPDVLRHPQNGGLHVVFYNSRKGAPELATLEDRSRFGSVAAWQFEDLGDPNFDEGYTPSIAVAPTGELAVAYYRCTRAAARLGDCKDGDDGLIFAWKDGDEWKREVVDEGGQGPCGNRPSLSFDGQGRPIIAYRCETLTDGQVEAQVKFARRSTLR
jgi:hypothetical protein